jgi:hypothetical protein
MIDGAVFSPVLAKQIEKAGIVAVVSLDRQEDAVPLARALLGWCECDGVDPANSSGA